MPAERTVVGTYVNPVTGKPYDGTNGRSQFLEFEPYPSTWIDKAGNRVLTGGGRAYLDESGQFQKKLICTDDTGILPEGRVYRIRQFVGNSSTVQYISVPQGTGSLDITDLLSVEIDGVLYVPVPGPPGPPGTAGTDGESAYQVARDQGFSGTEKEWLDSLEGPQGEPGPQPPLGAAGDGDAVALKSTDASTTNPRRPTGPAGGDLAGTYPNPSVARINGVEVVGEPTTGDALVATDTGTAEWSPVSFSDPWVFDVTAYGATPDAKLVTDGAMAAGSAVLTSASGAFEPEIVGKNIMVKGAGPAGVTSRIGFVQSRQSANQITLSMTNSSGGGITNALAVWGTDSTSAIQAAVDAAEAYLAAGHTYAQVWFPAGGYVVAGPLNRSKKGNGQIVYGVYDEAAGKPILEFAGVTPGAAAVRHWLQTAPQVSGSCLISFGLYASTAAQVDDINNYGNPAVICGPNEGTTNGPAYGAAARFSNLMAVVRDLTILTSHSSFGLTYGALNLWGTANAYVESFGYGTTGTVASPSTDYTSPGVFGSGLSIGLLLPAPGNNDAVIARNISCSGGYTYALFLTEHAVVDRYMALYCWAGLCPVGSYAGSVGSVHAMKVLSASIEACTNQLYIVGPGSEGVGPIVDIDQLSTESGTPTISGNSPSALKAALGIIKFTGLFTESGVNTTGPTGLLLVNGQVPRAIKKKTSAFTPGPLDRTLICDTTAAGFTATLPAADFNAVEYIFRNIGANTLTLSGSGGQLVYANNATGSATLAVAAGSTVRVQALFNGNAWGWYAL